MELFIPGRVVPKQRPRRNGKQTFMPANYREWKQKAIDTWIDPTRPVIEEPVSISIFFGGVQRGDIDNMAGSILDALVQAKVIEDDRIQIVQKLEAKYLGKKAEHGAKVLIYPIEVPF